jgi:hypothetical protein
VGGGGFLREQPYYVETFGLGDESWAPRMRETVSMASDRYLAIHLPIDSEEPRPLIPCVEHVPLIVLDERKGAETPTIVFHVYETLFKGNNFFTTLSTSFAQL